MQLPFFRRKYRTLNRIEVSGKALRANYRNLSALTHGVPLAPVLKSNAYGHGLDTVAPLFDSYKAPYLVVDSLYEAYELQKKSIKTPLLIMGYTHPENFRVKRLPFSYAIWDLETAEVLSRYQKGCRVHIFVDTGMNREGVKVHELATFLTRLRSLPGLNVDGLCSHFSDVSSVSKPSRAFTQKQLSVFEDSVRLMRAAGFDPIWRHISSSGGIPLDIHHTFTMIRAGIAAYGVQPDPRKPIRGITPAMRFISTLVSTKDITKGDVVGYSRTYQPTSAQRIGLIPAGYYEGVSRALSNKGSVGIDHRRAPIVGLVSMNMTVVDLTQCPNAKMGDEVTLISDHSEDPYSVEGISLLTGLPTYQIVAALSESVRRVIV